MMILQDNLKKGHQNRLFKSCWNWCEYEVPYINARWGARPVLVCPYTLQGEYYWYTKDCLQRLAQENTVIYLWYGMHQNHIEELLEAMSRVEEPRILVSFMKLRMEVPSNVRVINTEPYAYQFSRCLAEKTHQELEQRNQLTHSFTIMAINQCQGRHRLLLMLSRLGILKEARHSNPDLKASNHHFVHNSLGANEVLENISASTVDGTFERFNVRNNMDTLLPQIRRGRFYVSIDSNPLQIDRIGCVTEKIMWGVASVAPMVAIWDNNKAQQMQEWGFLFDNLGTRQSSETDQQAVQRWAERILLWYQITQDTEWNEQFQRQQQPQAQHNLTVARNLHQQIDSEIQQQIDELPQEFQNLR